MRLGNILRAAILAGLALPGIAMADDPKDPGMQTPDAVARDREQIRQLNLDMLRQVQQRDAGYAQGWRDYKRFKQGSHPNQIAYREARNRYERDSTRHTESRREYEREMDQWRANVRACRAGNYRACD